MRVTFSKSNITQEITRLKNLISQFPSQATENKASLKTKQQELANFDSLLASKIQQGTNAAQNQTTFIEEHSADWLVNSRNDLNLANNACKNAMQKDNYVKGSCTAKAIELKEVYNTDYKNSGSGWMPSLTATWLFNDNSRIYARYAETLRFPSLFESTSGFSGNPSASAPLQPERARLFETAYVHYFDNASAKITYFDQIIENVMDRDRDSFAFANLDSQRTSGIELNTHYDNTDYFADGSFAYNFRNEVCDKNTAAQLYAYDTIKKNTPSDETCVRGGFSKQSFLAAHAAPEYTANLLLGARFFNQDLEVGFRTNYVSGSHDEDVIKRTDVTTYDAYMKYKFTEKIAGELVGTNLSDVYYLEAGSVSGMPAPGRTIGVKLSGKF